MNTTMKTRVAMSSLALFIGALLIPGNAFAHAKLTKSAPTANERLSVLPTTIRLWFSEAPELVMTHIVLTDSAGHAVSVAAVERDETKLAVHVRIIGKLVAGKYKVAWRTAATDGHPSQGSFTFVVLAAAIHAAVPLPAPESARLSTGAGTATADEATAETPAYVLARALFFAALLAFIGVIAFAVFVAGRAALDGIEISRMRALAARVGTVAAVGLLLSAVARAWLQAAMMTSAGESTLAMLSMTITQTQWGTVWIVQMVAAFAGLISFGLLSRGARDGWWWVVSLAALVLAATPAFSGHAAAAPTRTGLAIVVDTLHVLGASAWLGSLMCVLIVGTSSSESHGDRLLRVKALVNAFSPTALVAASVVAATGALSAWLRLGSISALWSSTYGRVLLLKLGVLVGVAATGAFNWLRMQPALGTEVATVRLRRSASAELAIGCAVLVVTAILVATPTPFDVAN